MHSLTGQKLYCVLQGLDGKQGLVAWATAGLTWAPTSLFWESGITISAFWGRALPHRFAPVHQPIIQLLESVLLSWRYNPSSGSTELQANGMTGGVGSGHTAAFTRRGCDQDTEATILICWPEGNQSPFHSVMQPNWGLHHIHKCKLFAQESRALRWLASVAPYAAIARIQGVFFHANHVCLVMPRLHQSLLDVVVHSAALDKDALVSQVREIAMHMLVWLSKICVVWTIAFATLCQFNNRVGTA